MPLPAAFTGDRTGSILHKLKDGKPALSFRAPAVHFSTHAPRSDEAGTPHYGHRLRATGLAGLTRPPG
jgi:hypothetical protein